MKTSTLIAILAVTGGFATLTVVNFKLKSEYDKGKFENPYIKKTLPAFSHIKDLTDTNTLKNGRFEIRVGNSEEPGVATYYAARKTYNFDVRNDTLYISLDKTDQSPYSHWLPMIITTKQLESIDVVNGEYRIVSNINADLSIKAVRKAEVDVKAGGLKTLSIAAANTASIGVSAKDSIAAMNIRLDDNSSFNAKDLVIGQRSLQLGKRANLQLSGRSIENFGLRSRE